MAKNNSGLKRAQKNADRQYQSKRTAAQREAEKVALRDRLETAWLATWVAVGRPCDRPIDYTAWCRNIDTLCRAVKREEKKHGGLVDLFLQAKSAIDSEQIALDLVRAGIEGGAQSVGNQLAELSQCNDCDWMKAFDSSELVYRVLDPKRGKLFNDAFRANYVREKLPEILKTGKTLLAAIEIHNARLLMGATTVSNEIINQLFDAVIGTCQLISPLWIESRLPQAQDPQYAIALGPDSGVPTPINRIVQAVSDVLTELGCALPRFAGQKIIGSFGFAPPGVLKSHNLLRGAVYQFPPCPKCGEPLWPDEADRLCPACREHSEIFRFMVAVKTKSTIEEERVPNAATLKQLACKLFGHREFTEYHQHEPDSDTERSSTLARLEQWLDAKYQQRGETRRKARERWLATGTAEVIDLIDAELKGSEEDALLRHAGKAHLEELLAATTVEEVPHPEEVALRELLADDCVEGKFVPWWHHRIATAEGWRIVISPAWHVIADCLDILFPGTSNTFNIVSRRPHVQEDQLFVYLEREHGLVPDEIRVLTITQLASMLQQDCMARRTEATASGSAQSPARSGEQAEPNGPQPPNRFQWQGKCAELQLIPWRLVEFLWKTKNRTAEVQAVVDAVWGDDSTRSDSALKTAISRANTALLEKEIPVTVSQKSGHVSLTIVAT